MKKILIADDNESMRLLVAEILTNEGWSVQVVENGFEASKVIAKSADSFVLVLTDWDMPLVRGEEVVRVCKKVDPHLPVIVMSGDFHNSSLEDDMRLAGAAATIAKPFRPAELELVKRHVRTVRAQ